MSKEGESDFKRQLGVGIWEDKEGHVHFEIPKLLAYGKLEDTPENREMLLQTIETMAKENGANVTSIPLPPVEQRSPIKSYELAADGKSITCLKCMRTSWNPNDILYRYCGNCRLFHEDAVSPQQHEGE